MTISPIVIKITRKLKAKQNIYEYVDLHKKKQGTSTMGGIIFVIASVLAYICVSQKHNHLAVVSLICFVCFGIIGFLDDFLKIH